MSQQDDIRKMLLGFNRDQAEGLKRLAQAMGAPVKAELDYAGLVRRMFGYHDVGQSIWKHRRIDRIADGDLPIYDKDVP